MTEHTRNETYHTCDICRKECKPVRDLELLKYPNNAGFVNLTLTVDCSVDYVSDKYGGDVCIDCLLDGVKNWLKQHNKAVNDE